MNRFHFNAKTLLTWILEKSVYFIFPSTYVTLIHSHTNLCYLLSTSLCMCSSRLSVYQSIYLSIYLSLFLSFDQSSNRSTTVFVSIGLSTWHSLSIYLSVCVCVNIFIFSNFYQQNRTSVNPTSLSYLFFYLLSTCILVDSCFSIYLDTYLSLCLYISIHVIFYLFPCVCVYMRAHMHAYIYIYIYIYIERERERNTNRSH